MQSPVEGHPYCGCSHSQKGKSISSSYVRIIAKPAVAPDAPTDSMWELIGGRATFEKLVRELYVGVATDKVLLPMYPEQPDLEGAIQRLADFLEQYWGGPNSYSQERGHPRLRMRHMPLKVNPDACDRWLHDMRVALDTLELPPLYHAGIWAYLERAPHSLVRMLGKQLGKPDTTARRARS